MSPTPAIKCARTGIMRSTRLPCRKVSIHRCTLTTPVFRPVYRVTIRAKDVLLVVRHRTSSRRGLNSRLLLLLHGRRSGTFESWLRGLGMIITDGTSLSRFLSFLFFFFLFFIFENEMLTYGKVEWRICIEYLDTRPPQYRIPSSMAPSRRQRYGKRDCHRQWKHLERALRLCQPAQARRGWWW